jgi:type IV pilus assembly protein PilE
MRDPMNGTTTPRQAPSPGRRAGGFTLIELMIVVAIIAIISAVAVPSYTSHIAKSRRADARTQLLQGAQFMQRFYAANDQFEKDRANNDVIDKIPDSLKRAPADGNQLYELRVNATVTAYTLTMAPIAGTRMATDPCGSFTLNSVGVRGVTGTRSRDECWK